MSTEQELSGIKITRQKIENQYVFLPNPVGKVELTVAQNVTSKHRVLDDQGREKYIVNLKAIAPDQIEELINKFSEGDEIPIEELNGLTLTHSVWINDGQEPEHLPMKGEKVDCSVDYVQNREGQAVLRITNMVQRPVAQAEKVSFEKLFSKYGINAEEETVQTTA